ncbi:dihydroxyacetone kinase phosphoryl donor subunit DhaM [Cellulomonas sp. NPDC089187]|uniref:dihydroxyacetone kinase phosphoryl donor subunit DhaM n=1 Tax=Cellulomonas sp. NPDC089187 TaxID=3154970 RepID=UPI00341CCBFA
MSAGVALVLVSHSAAIADGLRDLAGQMAPGVLILPAGGDPAEGLGTSVDRVTEAIKTAAEDGRHVLVLTDLGSAVLTTELVLELLDEDVAARVQIADAPLVEGAVAAGVEAAGGAGIEAVRAAAEQAAGRPAAVTDEPEPATMAEDAGAITGQVTVRNPLGLHARPAAVLSRMMAGFDASVQVNGVNAASVLALMQLAATQGQVLTLSATGPQARAAVDAFIGAVDEGFGEV